MIHGAESLLTNTTASNNNAVTPADTPEPSTTDNTEHTINTPASSSSASSTASPSPNDNDNGNNSEPTMPTTPRYPLNPLLPLSRISTGLTTTTTTTTNTSPLLLEFPTQAHDQHQQASLADLNERIRLLEHQRELAILNERAYALAIADICNYIRPLEGFVLALVVVLLLMTG